MKMILDALDKVRRSEHRELREKGSNALTGSKFIWFTNPSNMSQKAKIAFASIRDSVHRTARAWSIKEAAAELWNFATRTWAAKG